MSTQRAMQSEPGQSLLLPPHPATHAANFEDFLTVTGLAAAEVLTSNLVTFALPRYRDTSGARQFAGLRPEAAWHPLFWLPRHIAGAMCLERDEDGRPVVQEDPEHHLVRAAISLALSGLYDEVDGTWVDVLALHGLDIADPSVIERVRSWLSGRDDPLLDGIDLTQYLDPASNTAVFGLTTEILEALRDCAAALHSDALAADLAGRLLGEDTADTAAFVTTIASLAAAFLPTTPPPGADTTWVPFQTLAASAQADDADRLGDQLLAVRAHYWPIMDQRIKDVNQPLVDIGAIEPKTEALAW